MAYRNNPDGVIAGISLAQQKEPNERGHHFINSAA
jgi:hypothetical protein